MAHANVNGIDLYYEIQGEGPPVVFAHGVGGNHASWFQQIPFFSRFYRVITFAHRGFGNSEDKNGLGRRSFVEDLRGLLDHLAIDKVSLVAQSMGGSTCMGFTVRYPGRVNALVMADTLVGITLPEPLRIQQQERREMTRNLSQMERVLSKSLPMREPAKAELYLQIASFNKHNANRLNQQGPAPEPITMDQVIAVARSIPMLFLVGSEDVLQPQDLVRAASELVPNAEFTVVENSGHSVYFEKPSVFNHAVHSYLSNLVLHE